MIFNVIRSQLDFKWSLNFFDAFDVGDLWPNATMTAEDALLFVGDDGSQRQIIKSIINLCKATIRIINVFSKPLGTLIAESEILVYISVFVVASEHDNLLWILQFQRHQQADDLQTIVTFVDVVAEEHIIKCMNIALIQWESPDIEESHQVNILTVEVTEDLQRRLNILYNRRLCTDNRRKLCCQLNDVFPFAREFCAWLDILSILRLQQRLNKYLTQRIIWIFIDLFVIFEIWIQSLRLFCKFVNRYLSHYQRKVFSLRLLLIRLRCNMSLICKMELSIHIVIAIRVLLNPILRSLILRIFLLRFDFLEQIVVIC